MSAQLTYELVTEEQHACYGNPLGYTLCAACYHSAPTPEYERSRDITGICDRCSSLLLYSIELVDGWAWIEHTPCKIF
jgi:hypothetical protein